MKKLEKKKMYVICGLLLLAFSLWACFGQSFGMKNYEEVNFATGMVTAKALRVRQGPGLQYKIITKVYQNQYIRVFAKIGNWYVIQTDQDIVGVVYADYIKPIYPHVQASTTKEGSKEDKEKSDEGGSVEAEKQEQPKEETSSNSNSSSGENQTNEEQTSTLTEDEQEVLDRINQARKDAGLNALEIDDDVQNACRLKAKDMVEKDYFSHQSPTYGSPFDLLKKQEISYKVAGENIAGNSSNEKAVESWMNSENHKKNILNNAYNYTGIAVVNSQKYGKIYVQIFIGK